MTIRDTGVFSPHPPSLPIYGETLPLNRRLSLCFSRILTNDTKSRQNERVAKAHVRLSPLRADHGFNPLAEEVLNGTYMAYDISPDMAAFYLMLARMPQEHRLPPVLGMITSADFQSMF